jgi:HAD superfamily hydrolase (TIGR01509 family)
VKAVVLDVDGTLVDSERDGHRVAFNAAFARAGLSDRWDPATYGELLAVPGGRQRLEAWFTGRGLSSARARELSKQLHANKTDIFCGLVASGRVPARAGATEFVDMLAASGVSLHVATTGRRAWVEPLLDRLFGAETFATVVTGSEIARLKPDPSVYLEVLRRSGLDPEETVAVEDSAVGLQAARGAGLACVVVTNHYTTDQEFTGAALVSDGYEDPRVQCWFRTWAGSS